MPKTGVDVHGQTKRSALGGSGEERKKREGKKVERGRMVGQGRRCREKEEEVARVMERVERLRKEGRKKEGS